MNLRIITILNTTDSYREMEKGVNWKFMHMVWNYGLKSSLL